MPCRIHIGAGFPCASENGTYGLTTRHTGAVDVPVQ